MKKKSKSGGKKSRPKKQTPGSFSRPKRTPAKPSVYRKPELLAPAGSPVTWAAAIEAGADAVYLGLKSFSARAYAANFSPAQLARVVEMTHEKGKKIYIAFNTMVKESELGDAARALDALTAIGPDALIVQDLGLMRLIKQHFPHFETHASTLTAVHNAPGLSVLAGIGYDRAVLARELTLREIAGLAASSPIGVEMFIHGALCFSFSGLCLMSSFLGGRGSLRGACTQPCRRLYASGRKKGYFFSPTDLDATSFIGAIREIPLAALKIEGRMKGADYVTRVVGAYRLLLDAEPEDFEAALNEAEARIQGSPGRRRSPGFLASPLAPDALAVTTSAASGVFLGRVDAGGAGRMVVALQEKAALGDRLRVQFKKGGEQKAFHLKSLQVGGQPAESAGPGEEAELSPPFELSPGDILFRVESAESAKAAEESALAMEVGRVSDRDVSFKPGPALKRALQEIDSSHGGRPPKSRAAPMKPDLWFRVARTEEVPALAELKPGRVILPLDTPNVRRMASFRKRLGALYNRVIWALPPLIFPAAMAALNRDLAQLARMGAREFMVANIGQIALVDREVRGRKGRPTVYGDHRLNCLNTVGEEQLARLGLAGATISLEADEETLDALLERAGPLPRMLYLYGRPALFTSRFRPSGLRENLPVQSPRGERFRLREHRDYITVFAQQPVFMSPLLKKRTLAGVSAFIVDLENDPRPAATAREVAEAVSRKKALGKTTRFNLGRGLF